MVAAELLEIQNIRVLLKYLHRLSKSRLIPKVFALSAKIADSARNNDYTYVQNN